MEIHGRRIGWTPGHRLGVPVLTSLSLAGNTAPERHLLAPVFDLSSLGVKSPDLIVISGIEVRGNPVPIVEEVGNAEFASNDHAESGSIRFEGTNIGEPLVHP
jgi:hypothetical protein